MIDMLALSYPWIKALHLAAVISWMAGMFYLPRLFVYHAERATPGSDLDRTFQIMERKLMKVIMGPAMIVTWLAGGALIGLGGFDWSMGWTWVKLAAVVVMTGCHVWLAQRQREFAAGANTRDGRTYRIANEVPTVLMLIIVVMVVVKPF